jgi:hypothetical protein
MMDMALDLRIGLEVLLGAPDLTVEKLAQRRRKLGLELALVARQDVIETFVSRHEGDGQRQILVRDQHDPSGAGQTLEDLGVDADARVVDHDHVGGHDPRGGLGSAPFLHNVDDVRRSRKRRLHGALDDGIPHRDENGAGFLEFGGGIAHGYPASRVDATAA